VGRAGTVLLSSDGASWRIRPFPAGVDLVSVRATDANIATVTATDGRRFSTADGGLTWSPAQE
ncbi:MAG: glycosyl hydrolase, partial [Acidobacteriota bacterium]